MNIAPQDLGDTLCKELLRQRQSLIKRKRKPLISLQISGRLAIVFLAALALCLLYHLPFAAFFSVGTIAAGILFASGALREYDQIKQQDWLSEYETFKLRDHVTDALTKTYLNLVLAIRPVPVTPGTAAEQEVRGAIRALGAAIDSLPPPEKELVTDDPGNLRLDAERLAAEAEVETDPVVLASLRRRADSLTRRAETAARTRLLLRRNGALREEVAEQIGALRTNLTAFRVGGEQAAQEMTGLAASIQRVTIEANAITAARDEIDALLSAPPGAFSALAAENEERQGMKSVKG